MARRSPTSVFATAYRRSLRTMGRATVAGGKRMLREVRRTAERLNRPPPGAGDWIAGVALGPAGARRFHLYRPPAASPPLGERLPLIVMLHGCGQTGRGLAMSTRMNQLALRKRFLVLYPEQDRVANAQGCWNWFERRSGKADAEVATIMAAIDQACLLHGADRSRIAIAGLSAGASMAALVASRNAGRFKAVAMHSGVAPGAAMSAWTALDAMVGKRSAPVIATAVGKAIGAAAQLATLPALLVMHGDADRVVSISNAKTMASVWAAATGAQQTAERTSQRGKRRAVRRTDYKRKGRTMVTMCEIAGLGHAWSGGLGSQPFSDPAGPDATRMVWAFAQHAFGSAAHAGKAMVAR